MKVEKVRLWKQAAVAYFMRLPVTRMERLRKGVKLFVIIADNSIENQNMYVFNNISLGHYRYTNLLGGPGVIFKFLVPFHMSLEKKAIFLLFLPKFHKKYDMLDIKV
jgi:hypothetical protein